MQEADGALADEHVGIGSLVAFFAWASLNFFAVPFLLLASMLCFANLPDSLRALSGQGPPNLGLRLFGFPSLVALASGCFSNCFYFPTYYRARFPAAGIAEALIVILLSGSLFWVGLLTFAHIFAVQFVQSIPAYAVPIPFLIGGLLMASNALTARLFRNGYRYVMRRGGWTDRLTQDFPRFVLGKEAWQRYQDWLWNDTRDRVRWSDAVPWMFRFAGGLFNAFVRIFLSVSIAAAVTILSIDLVSALTPESMPWIGAVDGMRIALSFGAIFALLNICLGFDWLVEVDHREHFFGALVIVVGTTFAFAWVTLAAWLALASPPGGLPTLSHAITIAWIVLGFFFLGRVMTPINRAMGRI